jgi:hypothetical protein
VTNERLRSIALVLTLIVHFAVIGGLAVTGRCEADRLAKRANLEEEQLQHIEAGLAVKSKSARGRKSHQPQKDVQHKVSPNDIVVAKDDKSKPPDDKDKKKDEKPDNEVDPESVFNKHREGAEGKPTDEPAAEAPGADEENKAGQADGSDFGRLDKATGDAYEGELVGRMTVNPDLEVPSTVPEGTNLETWGCLKLSPDGKVANVQLDPEHKSGNAAFNSAVLRRLKLTTDMDKPVPDKLKGDLVEKWACVPYRY